MSAVFDASRFLRLFKSHWAENRRGYAWFAGIAAMVDLIVIILIFMAEKENGRYRAFAFDNQISWFFTGIFITGIIFSARYAHGLSNAGAALVTLMRPASHFEKWMLAVSWILVLFPLAYTALYIFLHWPSVQIAHHLNELLPPETKSNPSKFNFYIPFLTFDESDDISKRQKFFVGQCLLFLLLGTLQAFCVGCKYFFKKSATLKMTVLGFVIFLVILGCSVILDVDFSIAMNDWMDKHPAGWKIQILDQIISNALLIGVPLLLWAAVYFCLQEREIS